MIADLYMHEIFKVQAKVKLSDSGAVWSLGVVGANKFNMESLLYPVARLVALYRRHVEKDMRPQKEIIEECHEYFETHAVLKNQDGNKGLTFTSYYLNESAPDTYMIKTLDINFGSKIEKEDVEALISL